MQPIKPKKRTTLYLDPSIHKEYKEICDREGESMSQKTESLIQQYVNIHRVGNPQMLLDTFGSELSLICVYCGKGGFKSLRRVETHGGTMSVCQGCFEDLKFRRLIKK